MTPTSEQRRLALQRALTEAWLQEQASPNTRAAYRLDLASFGHWCTQQGAVPLAADATTLVAFQVAREQAGDSAATIRRRWSALASFYDFAVRSDAAETNPVLGVQRPKLVADRLVPRLTPEAVAIYREQAAALDPRLEALVALLTVDGLKMNEALALDVTDLRGRVPKVTIAVRRKGESHRVVLHLDSAHALRRCAAGRRDGPLFTSGRPATGVAPRRLTRFGADHLIRQLGGGEEARRVTANAFRRFHQQHSTAD
jgi:site-specific recombinase XerD